MYICSLNLEQTGEIIQFSLLLKFSLELEQFILLWVVLIGDLWLLMLKYFLFDGAGDLKALWPLEIGV